MNTRLGFSSYSIFIVQTGHVAPKRKTDEPDLANLAARIKRTAP